MFSFILDIFLKDLRKTIFDFCNSIKEDKILDIGCGEGEQLFYLKNKRNNIFLFGVDINEKSIKKAKKKVKELSFKNINFLACNAKKLPFKNNFFDFVLISLVLHENKKEEALLIINEAERVLKNGGFFILADFNTPLFKNFSGILIRIIEFFIGKDNYKNFKDYLKIGGLDYFLNKAKNLKKEKEKFLLSGNIKVLKLKKYGKIS